MKLKSPRFRKSRGPLLAIATLLPILFLYTNCGQFGTTEMTKLESSSVDQADPGATEDPPPSGGGSPVVTPNPTATPVPSEGANRRAVFVASGKVGRTVMSCDDGRTWIRDRSDSATARCGDALDCDHHSGSAHGLTYGDGWFFANYGWGSPGSVRRSRDGYNWEVVATTTSGGGGLAYFPTGLVWVAFTNYSLSTNLGATWTSLNNTVGYFLSRNVTSAGTTVIVTGDSVTTAKISRDSGRTWGDFSIPGIDLSGRNFQIVAAGGVMIGVGSVSTFNQVTGIVTTMAYMARSSDGGVTWTAQPTQTIANYTFWGKLIHDGTRFITWLDRRMWTSPNGLTWTQTNTNLPGGVELGGIARGPTGTFVSIPNNFGEQYAGQYALRSLDGLTWTRLPATALTGGHPIIEIASGYVDSTVCP